MADKYGFNIEIGLDSSQLNRGLKEVKDNLSTAKTELRTIDKELKANPKNVELWKKKQSVLNSAINETKKKLELQNKQLDLANKNFNGTEEARDKINALKYSINKTNNEIKKLTLQSEQATKELSDLSRINFDKLGNFGSSLTRKVTMPVLTLTTALGGLAFKTANTVDEIADKADRVGATAKGYQELIYVTKILGGNADALQRGFIKINAMMGDIASGKSLKAAQTLSKLGLTIEDIKGKDTTEVFQIIRDEIAKLGDEALMTSIANEIFGDRIGSELLPVLKAEKETIQGLTNEANSLGVANQSQIEMSGKFTDAVDRLKQAFFGVTLTIGNYLIPKLTEAFNIIAEKIGPVTQGLINKWNSLSDTTQKLVLGIGATAVGFGPLLLVTTKIITAVTSLSSGFGSLISLGPKLLTSFGPVGLAIGAVTAALVSAYNTNEDFRESVHELFNNFKELLGPINDLVKVLVDAFKPILDILLESFGEIITAVAPVLTILVKELSKGLTFISKVISVVVDLVGKYLTPVIKTLGEVIKPVFDMFNKLINLVGDFVKKIKELGDKVGDKLFGWIGDAVENTKDFFGGIGDMFKMNTNNTTNNSVSVYTSSSTIDFDTVNKYLGGHYL